jgi:6-phosphogluconolactonase
LSLIILAEISLFWKNNDGSIGESKQVVQHYGKGSNAKRQEGPHSYGSFSQTESLSNDLGNDKVYSYKYNPNSASTVLKVNSFAVEAGSGPRHLTFSKMGGMFMYYRNLLEV